MSNLTHEQARELAQKCDQYYRDWSARKLARYILSLPQGDKVKPMAALAAGWFQCDCGAGNLRSGYTFCPDCGAALDWSKEKEKV